MIFEAVWLYKWTILTAITIAPVLAMMGAQSLARGWSLRALVVAQGTSLGTYLGLLVIGWMGWVHDSGHTQDDFLQFLFILGVSVFVAATIGAITIWIEERLLSSSDPSRPQIIMAFFTLVLAGSSLIVALSPNLESHLASAFKGDLSTASDLESRLTFGLGMGVLGWIWLKWMPLSKAAFERVVLLREERLTAHLDLKFSIMTVLAMALTVHALGVLFVIGSLFIPSSMLILAGGKKQRLQSFRWQLLTTAAVGSLIGFGISLKSTTLPTAPTVIFCQALVGLLLGWLSRFSKN